MRILKLLSGAARVETAEAQLKSAQALHDKAVESAERRSEPGN